MQNSRSIAKDLGSTLCFLHVCVLFYISLCLSFSACPRLFLLFSLSVEAGLWAFPDLTHFWGNCKLAWSQNHPTSDKVDLK